MYCFALFTTQWIFFRIKHFFVQTLSIKKSKVKQNQYLVGVSRPNSKPGPALQHDWHELLKHVTDEALELWQLARHSLSIIEFCIVCVK